MRRSPRRKAASGSCAADASRCSTPARTGSRRRARMPGRDCAAAATSSTRTLPTSASSRRPWCASSSPGWPRMDVDVAVEPVPGDTDGLGWRTRVEFAVDDAGRAGLRGTGRTTSSPSTLPHRRPARPGDRGAGRATGPGESAVDVAAPSEGEAVVVARPLRRGGRSGRHRARCGTELLGHLRGVGARGFWQVHPGAAATFVDTVTRACSRPSRARPPSTCMPGSACSPRPWPSAWGSPARSSRWSPTREPSRSAAGNLAAYPSVAVVRARVDDAFGVPGRSRSGRRATARSAPASCAAPAAAAARRPGRARPAAHRGRARRRRAGGGAGAPGDRLRRLRPGGAGPRHGLPRGGRLRLRTLRAFDAFPMTHHVECIALFERTSG